MNETLTEIAGFKLTVSIAGTAISILLLILFAALWIWLIPKKTEEGRFRRRWLDALGFGLLPAAAGWKVVPAEKKPGSCWTSAGRATERCV